MYTDDRDYPWTEVEQDALERQWERMCKEYYEWLDTLQVVGVDEQRAS